jgi:hypothetical protein
MFVPTMNELVDRYGKQRNLALSLGCYLIADAFFPQNRLLNYGILALMVFTGPLATGRTNRQRVMTVILALLTVILGLLASSVPSDAVLLMASLTAAAFFFSLIFLISHALLFEQEAVTGETLWAAVNVYVLMGMMFAFLYAAVSVVEPEAFSGNLLDGNEAVTETFLYYSYVTMTTLGYGDITPQIHFAAMLAYVQALIGQLYVAILIARLVSLYSSQTKE